MSDERVSSIPGKPALPEMLVDLSRLEQEYFNRAPNVDYSSQLVRFGTSGHCGSSLNALFNEAHILAITQAICDYRKTQGTNGPLAKLIRAPGNGAAVEGLKVVPKCAWFAAQPSAIENNYKIYGESFRDDAHLGPWK